MRSTRFLLVMGVLLLSLPSGFTSTNAAISNADDALDRHIDNPSCITSGNSFGDCISINGKNSVLKGNGYAIFWDRSSVAYGVYIAANSVSDYYNGVYNYVVYGNILDAKTRIKNRTQTINTAMSVNITNCTTINASNKVYALDRDIDGSWYAPLGKSYDGCIDIIGENITFNGNGHTIFGNNQTEVFGIYSTANNVLVKNVITDGFYAGVEFFGTENGTMTNITAKYGGLVSNFGKNILVNNSSASGIFGFYGRYNENITVKDSSFSSASSYVINNEYLSGNNYFVRNKITALSNSTSPITTIGDAATCIENNITTEPISG